MWLETFLIRFGAWAVLVGSALEGDLVPVLAGVISHVGYVSVPTAIVAAGSGILLGDSLWFALGRRAGGRLRRWPAWQRVGSTVEGLAGRYGPLEIALARVVYGTRNVSMLFWGAQGLAFTRFLLIDAPVAFGWAAVLVGLGHAATHGAEAVLGEVERVERWLAGALVLGLAALLALVLARRKRWPRAQKPGRSRP